MIESDVLSKTKAFLEEDHLQGFQLSRLFTDSHSQLRSLSTLKPFQRFHLHVGDLTVHPDLVGQLTDGETLFAVEAKGTGGDVLRGLAQAELYQAGFHYSFLAADAVDIGETLADLAQRKNIGLLAVSDSVRLLHQPKAHLPQRDAFDFISRQMGAVVQVSTQQTYHFNVPTHYLVWAIVFPPHTSIPKTELPSLVDGYPMPKEVDQAIAGARKLGILKDLGDNSYQLTDVGAAVKDILPTSLNQWADLHHTLVAHKRDRTPLQHFLPSAAAILRLLLLQDPIVQLVIEGIQTFEGRSVSFSQLAIRCDELDHARAPIFFFKPQALPDITDDRGRILWPQVERSHYRSKNFHQYKRILQHAGILIPNKLGGSSTSKSDPDNDIWALL